jgi:hypothetical protein
MERRAYILTTKDRRKYVADLVARLEKFSRVEIKGPQRTRDQNSALWPALTDISEQHQHHGITLTPQAWRLVFLDYFWRLKHQELQMVPNLTGNGFVPLDGRSTSDLSVPEMSEFLDLIHATGAEWGVRFHGDAPPEEAGDIIEGEFTEVKAITDGSQGSGSGTTRPEKAA